VLTVVSRYINQENKVVIPSTISCKFSLIFSESSKLQLLFKNFKALLTNLKAALLYPFYLIDKRTHRMVGVQSMRAGVLVVTRLLFNDGIQLNGLPASPAEITDAYSPFHPAGQPFHRIQPHPQRLNTHHSHPTVGRSVSAQEPRLSPHTLTGATVQHGGRSFLRQQSPKPSASSPTS
jgi:hypothetical protein